MRLRLIVLLLAVVCLPTLVQAQPVTQPFHFSILEHDLPLVRHGSTSWGDIDGDGDLDLFLSGESEDGIVSGIYVNNGAADGGSGSTDLFTPLTANIERVAYSASSWGDADGDGDLDLVVMGSRTLSYPYDRVTALYRNDGGSFTRVQAGFPDLHSGSISWGDMDNDGDLDIVLTGSVSDEVGMTAIVRKQSDGSWSWSDTELPGIAFGDSEIGDIDGDGDQDLVLAGVGADGFTTKVYLNDAGNLTPLAEEFGSFAFASADLGDYDHDGDLDLVSSGGEISSNLMDGAIKLWKNNGGSFSEVAVELQGVLAGDVSWGDYDQDGDLDLMILGADNILGRRNALIYRNDGDDQFVNNSILVGSIFSDLEWGDYDGDGDLDLMTTGFTPYGQTTTSLYVNHRQVIPPVPAAPAGLSAAVEDASVELTWLPALQSDAVNQQLSYNVRVGTAPGRGDVVAAMSDPATGRLFKPYAGNVVLSTTKTLQNLPDGTYYWSVQAVNTAFVASTFASEGSFSISGGYSVDTKSDAELPRAFAVLPSYPNPFSISTTLDYELPDVADVSFSVYSMLGREVFRSRPGARTAGRHQLTWTGVDANGQKLGSGIYLYELRADSRVQTGTLTLIR